MNDISACLDSINDIEDQVFLAECDTMLANDKWLNKISDMVEYSRDFDNVMGYIQEAGYGRRDTGGNKWISKIRTFILRCIDKIVDAITNFLLKLKTRNAEYVRIPYKYEDLMEDINLVKSIDKEIYRIFDNVESFTSVDNVHKLTAIKEKLRNTHFAKNQRLLISDKDPEAHNKNNKYGIKPAQYIKLAKELRDLNRALKDTKTRASKMVQKEWLKEPESIDKPRVVVQELLFNIYTEMSKMLVKLMQSFTVSGVEKMDQAVIEKKIQSVKNGIIELQKMVGESVEYNINDDLEYFDETDKPYDEYLKKHNYDPKTNTIEINGERRNAGAVPSTKERNRINKFLRENKYDPKTETYESDIKNKDGKPERIKLNIVPNTNEYENSHNFTRIKRTGELIDDNINLTQETLKRKPVKSNQSLKHEEGHANQERGSDSGHVQDASYHIWANPLSKETQNYHYNKDELDADMYGYQHNRYANKDKQNKTGLERRYKDSTDKSFDTAIKRKEDKYENQKEYKKKEISNEIIQNTKYTLTETIKMKERKIKSIHEDIKEISDELTKEINVDKKHELEDELKLSEKIKERTEKVLIELNEKLSRVKNGDYNFTVGNGKYDVNTVQEDIDNSIRAYIDSVTKEIEQLKRFRDDVKQETKYRNQFLDQHADEAGSQARKLEGRQGKHKGKK